jgi:hypothetical protein
MFEGGAAYLETLDRQLHREASASTDPTSDYLAVRERQRQAAADALAALPLERRPGASAFMDRLVTRPQPESAAPPAASAARASSPTQSEIDHILAEIAAADPSNAEPICVVRDVILPLREPSDPEPEASPSEEALETDHLTRSTWLPPIERDNTFEPDLRTRPKSRSRPPPVASPDVGQNNDEERDLRRAFVRTHHPRCVSMRSTRRSSSLTAAAWPFMARIIVSSWMPPIGPLGTAGFQPRSGRRKVMSIDLTMSLVPFDLARTSDHCGSA